MGVFETSSKPRELTPEGKHIGILYSVVDLGTHNDKYNDEDRIKHQVHLTWEFPNVLMSDGRPFVYGATYTITDGAYGPYFSKSSNICKMLREWTGLDEKACSKVGLLGRLVKEKTPCYITISHVEGRKDSTKTYAVADSIRPCKSSGKIPATVNPAMLYGPVTDPIPETLPEWMKERIKSCLELNGGVPPRKRDEGSFNGAPESRNIDEDIPF